MKSIETFRTNALSQTLFAPTSLIQAINRLQFIQIDPITSPAKAHDLILYHRVKDYQVGTLEQQSSQMKIEEDFLYAHGFMLPKIWQWLHPRKNLRLSAFDKEVLQIVQKLDRIHPNDLKPYFERKLVRNDWGGKSLATKRSLDILHYYGFVRIAGREKNLRLCQAIQTPTKPLPTEERLRALIHTIVSLLAPVHTKTLAQSLFRIRRHLGPTQKIIAQMIEQGDLVATQLDKQTYLSPSILPEATDVSDKVLIVTPFDPIVWDRIRFEHLYGWPYRFEAYTPPAKRMRGYYAMPLIWQEQAIGWANLKIVNQQLDVDLGFVQNQLTSKVFKAALDTEIDRFKFFLKLQSH